MGIGCAHPTSHKFLQFTRTEQSLFEKKLVRITAVESAAKVTNYEKSQADYLKSLNIKATIMFSSNLRASRSILILSFFVL